MQAERRPQAFLGGQQSIEGLQEHAFKLQQRVTTLVASNKRLAQKKADFQTLLEKCEERTRSADQKAEDTAKEIKIRNDKIRSLDTQIETLTARVQELEKTRELASMSSDDLERQQKEIRTQLEHRAKARQTALVQRERAVAREQAALGRQLERQQARLGVRGAPRL